MFFRFLFDESWLIIGLITGLLTGRIGDGSPLAAESGSQNGDKWEENGDYR